MADSYWNGINENDPDAPAFMGLKIGTQWNQRPQHQSNKLVITDQDQKFIP
jgi:hypothetical protein